MPPGTPYNSYVLPYRIRVDDFSAPASQDPDTTPLLHLLTHTHSDHINGLSARSFGYKVICSKDAKEMLLRHEVYAERELQALDLRAEKIRTYAHLKVDPLCHPDGTVYYTGSRDLLHVLPLNSPTCIELTANESVTLTLIDANHCPGAVMYLIEGPRGNILHTGDFRAEPWFLQSVARNSILQSYLAPDIAPNGIRDTNTHTLPPLSVSKTLDAIYLDTACVLSPLSVPPKDFATTGLVELMKMYPDSVYFFINSWTWGYEDILKSVARAFQAKIHVDRYKYSVFQHIEDTFSKLITTRDPSSTRFHACERFHRCKFVDVENDASYSNAISALGKRVVYVNPVTMSTDAWGQYLENTKSRIRGGEEVNNLLVPLSRHSPLPELQEFVKLFRPKRVVPNTLDPRLHGLDWAYIERIFAPYLCPVSQVSATRNIELGAGLDALDPKALNDGDVALKNLVGSGASDVAEQWADDGKLLKRLSFIKSYLGDEESQLIDNLLGIRPEERVLQSFPVYDKPNIRKSDPPKFLDRSSSPNHARGNEGDSDEDSNDERGRTAHALFANLAGVDPEDKENAWWFTSPTSSAEKQPTSSVSRSGERGRGGEPRDGTWRLNRFTPIPSPVRIPRNPSTSTPKHSVHRIGAIEGQSPKPFLVQTPASHSRKQSIVEDLQLASPFCLPSSSRPAVQIAKTQSPLRVSSPHEAPVDVFTTHKSQPLHPEHGFSSLDLTNTNTYETNLENRHEHVPSDTSVPETPPHLSRSAASSSTPSVRKRFPDDIEDISKTKKRRFKPNSRDEEPMTSASECLKHDGSLSPVSLRELTSHQLARSTVAWVPTEREYWHRRRISMSQKIAEALPDMVAPSFQKKRQRQMAQVERKGKDRVLAASSSDLTNLIKESNLKPLPMLDGTLNRKLMPEPTLLSFESVHDENESKMDWNRSKLLAEAISRDVANGRKPVIPPLQCAQSQSP